MNSFNGDLYFAAGIDDSKFNVTTEAMERRVQEMSASVQSEAADMETSIQQFAQKGAEYITTFLVGKGMVDLTKSIIEVRGQFQQLEIAFETMLGSTEKANDLMAQLTQTAAKTPFDLQGVAQGAKQLLAYGTAAEEVNDVLVHLGDIASGLSIPLNDLVMLYGTTMTQGRMFTQDLRQFMGRGIPIAEELAKQFGVTKDKVGELVTQGKVTSKEFNAAIMAMSSEGGKFYNLMEKQSASLTGQISNLEDAWDVARNNIGKNMEGIAGDAISMATSIVENLEPIMHTVRAVAIAYGSYRAALILNSLATKGETGVALIDNTVKKAKIQLLRLEEKATSGAAERIRELKKARQEEIATLENQLSAEERLNLIHNTRIANIGKVLTETQKLELCNLGLIDSTGNLTGSTEDYERIALSMMSNEQRMDVERGELTKNTGDYIAKLHEAVDAKHINIKAIDDEIAKTQDELKFAVEYRNVVQEQVATSRDRCKSLENEISMLDLAGDEEGAAAKATEWKAEKTKLATLEEELNTAATSVNEKQTNLETLAKKRNAAATVQGTVADKENTATKNLLTIATEKATLAIKELWAAMKANPLGWILTAFGAVVAVIDLFRKKSGEAEVREGSLANATKKASEEFEKERSKVEALTTIIHDNNVSIEERKKKLQELKAIIPDYHADLTTEGQLINDNTDAIKNYCTELEKQIRLKAAQEELEEAYRNKRKAEKNQKAAQAEYERASENMNRASASGAYGAGEWGAQQAYGDSQWVIRASNAVKDAERELSTIEQDITELTNEIAEASVASTETAENSVTVAQRRAELVKKIAALEKEIKKALAPGATYDEKTIKQKQDELKTLRQELQTLNGGRTQKQIDQQLENEKKLAQKQLEMQAESRRAEIEAMEDGWEKKMAQLEYEHQQELAKIDKDAEELKAARKKAGGAEELTPEEEANINSRRSAVNKRYGNNRAALAEDEINTMREKYREYEKWVELVGREAADKHFKGLREQGESFTDWLDNKTAELERRMIEKGLGWTGNDQKEYNLFRDARTGADELNYYDDLRRGMDESIASATNLTAKIRILNEAINAINNDKKLTQQERDTLITGYAEQLVNAEAENQRRFNETYQMYSKTRRETIEQYQADIDRLVHAGDTFQVEQVRAEMKRAIGDLDENFLKSLFGEVFSGKATTKAIRAAVKDLNKMKGMDLVTFNSTYNTDFTQEELDALREKIDAVNSSLKNMSGYNIADAFKDIRDGRLEGDLERVARGTQYIQNAFQNFTSVVSALSSALNDLAEASDNENLKNTAKTVNQVSNVLNTAGQWAGMGASIGGGWGAAIGAVLGGGLGIFTEIFKSEQEKEERAAKAAEEGVEYQKMVADQLVSILGAVQSLTDTVTSLNYKQYRSTLLSLIDELEKGDNYYTNGYNGKKFWNYLYDAAKGHGASDMGWAGSSLFFGTETNPENISNIWKKMVEAGLISAEEALQRYNQARNDSIFDANAVGEGMDFWENVNNFLFSWIDHATGSYEPDYYIDQETFTKNNAESIANYLNWMAGQFEEEQKALIGRLNELYLSNSYDSLEYFNTENDVYQSQLDELRFYQAVLSILGEDTTEIDQQIRELEHTMGESLQHMAEGLFGIDIQGLIDEWISIFEEFGNNVDAAFDKIDESIDRMVANMLQKRLIVEPMMKYFTEIFQKYEDEDGNIDDEDFYNIAQDIREGKEEFKNRYLAYLEALREARIEFDSSIADPSTLTGSIQNVSEETGGIIAGRLNAVVINQAEGVSVMRQQLLVQYEMRNSLAAIQSDVNSIKQRIGNTATPNPYLYRGIV